MIVVKPSADSMEVIGARARASAQSLAGTSTELRNAALAAIRESLDSHRAAILTANGEDLAAARASGLSPAVFKRLILDGPKFDGLLRGLDDLIALPDPLGSQSLHREITVGLHLRRVSCPIGVLAVIFEARPEAVVQIASLAIKSGNATILKGGKEAARSNEALVRAIRDALARVAAAAPADGAAPSSGASPAPHAGASAASAAAGAASPARDAPPLGSLEDVVQLVATREQVADLLKLDQYIDLVIPRGSNALVRDIKAATRIPVMGHADGICLVYIDGAADPRKASTIALDSKVNYPAACNAAETLLVSASILETLFPPIASVLIRGGVTLHCDPLTLPLAARALEAATAASAEAAAAGGGAAAAETPPATPAAPLGAVVAASEDDWTMEWLSMDMSVRVVSDVAAAVSWINAHGSHHTDAIVTEDPRAADYFQRNVDSAGVYVNASTRFADGFRYGFGAEVGVSTGRLHARGPVGMEGLLTYKYLMAGEGHCVAQMVAKAGDAAATPSAGVVVGDEKLPALAFTHRNL